MISSTYRGHGIVLTGQDPQRACGHCGSVATTEGHDACLGTLPGALNACCGHGTTREACSGEPQ
jgi:hypothetical protein